MSSNRKSFSTVKDEEKRKQKVHHKHKKHKQKHSNDDDMDDNEPNKPLKLTLKIGGQTLAEKSVVKSTIRSSDNQIVDCYNDDEESDSVNYDNFDDNITRNEADEEDVWLDALEEGRLHEVDDELKKIKDPKLMTARQRALMENKSLKKKEDTIKLTDNNAVNVNMSEEMMQRKMLKDKRRRQQAEEKKEKDKKQTIERLLRKKQEAAKAKKKKKLETPKLSYKNNQKGIFISIPKGVVLDLLATNSRTENHYSTPVKCSRDGCNNNKKYSCSKTKLPLCSFECYKEVNKQLSVT